MACQCFVSIDRGQLLQTTALDIREEKTAAVSILRRPDKLRHVAAVFAERTLGTLTPLYTRERFFRGVAAGRKVRDWLPKATVSERRSFKIEHERTTASMISYMGVERLKLGRTAAATRHFPSKRPSMSSTAQTPPPGTQRPTPTSTLSGGSKFPARRGCSNSHAFRAARQRQTASHPDSARSNPA